MSLLRKWVEEGQLIQPTLWPSKNSQSSVVQVKWLLMFPVENRRKLFYEDTNVGSEHVDKKAEPERNMDISRINDEEIKKLFNKKYLLWQYIQKLNNFNQIVPSFKGWAMQIRKQETILKTV
jgi:hypothetical protein